MTWTKLSDDFPDDCYQLSDAAFRLHVEGMCWSNRKLLDLRLDKGEMRRWATNPASAGELVGLGWWTDEGDHYMIRHHARYQRSREQVVKQQEANKRNGALGGKAPRERFSRNRSSSESLSESLSERDGTGRDGTGAFKGRALEETDCAYCGVELTPAQRSSGYCDRPECRELT